MAARRVTHKDVAYWLEDVVFLRIREERKPGMVTAITIAPTGVMFTVRFDEAESEHYEFELTSEFLPSYGNPEDDE